MVLHILRPEKHGIVFRRIKNFFSPGTTLKSMKLSCNVASSTATVCDNVWQIAGSAVKGLSKKQQTSSIAANSANRPLNAVSRLLSTSASTRLVSAIRSSSSPHNSLVNLKCRKIAAFCMNFEKCHLVLEALHGFVQITKQLVPSL